MQASVGIVGLGLVGSALAERLVAAGFSLVGFDVAAERRSEFISLGGSALPSADEVFRSSNRVLLSLPTSEIVRSVLSSVTCNLDGKLVIDTTTGEPEEMAEVGREVSGRGGQYLVATIAGSSTLVRRGEALLMLGGSSEVVAACEDLLATFSIRRFHLGDWQAAARMKLVVNLVLGLNRAVLAEGLGFARACGIDPSIALEVLKAGPAASRAMESKGERMIRADFTPEARLAQHAKDVQLILNQGESLSAHLPLSTLHYTLLTGLIEQGFGQEDNSAIMRAFQRESG